MKKLIIFAASLIASSAAFASPLTVSKQASLNLGAYASKSAAYDAGFKLSNSLQSMDQAQLRQELPLWAYNPARNIVVNDSSVAIQEVASSPDNVQYYATVNVDYRFKTNESNH